MLIDKIIRATQRPRGQRGSMPFLPSAPWIYVHVHTQRHAHTHKHTLCATLAFSWKPCSILFGNFESLISFPAPPGVEVRPSLYKHLKKKPDVTPCTCVSAANFLQHANFVLPWAENTLGRSLRLCSKQAPWQFLWKQNRLIILQGGCCCHTT